MTTLNELIYYGKNKDTYFYCLEMHTLFLGEKMWMFSTLDWTPQAELHTLANKADSLSPAEVKGKVQRLAEAGKVCACGSSKNCFEESTGCTTVDS